MPKDPSKNVDRYKIRGGTLNEFEFTQNQEALAENKPEKGAQLIPGTPPEQRQQPQVATKQTAAKKAAAKKATTKKAATKKSATKSAKKNTQSTKTSARTNAKGAKTEKSAKGTKKSAKSSKKTKPVATRGASAKKLAARKALKK